MKLRKQVLSCGLLAEPVKVTELPILMGERFEVLVDTSDGGSVIIATRKSLSRISSLVKSSALTSFQLLPMALFFIS